MTTLVLLVPLLLNAVILALIWQQICTDEPQAQH
jgi:hypothetical protein